MTQARSPGRTPFRHQSPLCASAHCGVNTQHPPKGQTGESEGKGLSCRPGSAAGPLSSASEDHLWTGSDGGPSEGRRAMEQTRSLLPSCTGPAFTSTRALGIVSHLPVSPRARCCSESLTGTLTWHPQHSPVREVTFLFSPTDENTEGLKSLLDTASRSGGLILVILPLPPARPTVRATSGHRQTRSRHHFLVSWAEQMRADTLALTGPRASRSSAGLAGLRRCPPRAPERRRTVQRRGEALVPPPLHLLLLHLNPLLRHSPLPNGNETAQTGSYETKSSRVSYAHFQSRPTNVFSG